MAALAADLEGRNDEVRSLTFGAYLTTRWLPAKRVVLADTTYDGYRRNIERHVLPALGQIGLRRLRPQHLESLYDKLLHPVDGAHPLAPKTAYEIHLVIRGALADAVRRGLVRRNVALVAIAQGSGRSPRSNNKPGRRQNCSSSCTSRHVIVTSRRLLTDIEDEDGGDTLDEDERCSTCRRSCSP